MFMTICERRKMSLSSKTRGNVSLKKTDAKTVVSMIKNGSTLALCGFTLMGACEEFLIEIEKSFELSFTRIF
jgi:DeoR/GlpR family transcriptional regulator of sugar metabolism